MVDADLIVLYEPSPTGWLCRRHGIYDHYHRAIVHTAAFLFPRLRCRLWAYKHYYTLGPRMIYPPPGEEVPFLEVGLVALESEMLALEIQRREQSIRSFSNLPSPHPPNPAHELRSQPKRQSSQRT